MKKQINDLTELVQSKNQEIEDLRRNIKSTKLTELQEEVLLYQKECMKLRYISELSVCILMQNGLYKQLKGNKRLKGFINTINWQNFQVKNAVSDIQQAAEIQAQERRQSSPEKNRGAQRSSSPSKRSREEALPGPHPNQPPQTTDAPSTHAQRPASSQDHLPD